MKKIFYILLFAGLFAGHTYAQEVIRQLDQANSTYSSGDLHEARFALQQALHEIDLAIGAEILALLPAKMGTLAIEPDTDNVTPVGFVGLVVSRNYRCDKEGIDYSSIEIITDSPMLAGINALLALPMFGSDPNQKRIRVGGNRALLQKNEDSDGRISWSVQVPLGNTLLTFNYNSPADEKKITDLANSLPIDAIVKLTR